MLRNGGEFKLSCKEQVGQLINKEYIETPTLANIYSKRPEKWLIENIRV